MIFSSFYILKKLFNKLIFLLFKKTSISEGVFLIGNSYKIKKSRIVFDLSNPSFFHLGDTLFYEPIIRLLAANYFNVYVIPISSMKFYFKLLGYSVISKKNKDDFIITSKDMILENFRFNSLMIDTSNNKIKHRLIDNIKLVLINYLDLKTDVSSVPKSPNVNSYIFDKINFKNEIIVFSNYIDSGNFRVFNRKRKELYNFLKNYANDNNLTVLHIGTSKDKLNDKFNYRELKKYIDFRGNTKVSDLFFLFNNLNITYVGFDNFLMHLGFMCESKLYVKSRGRYTKNGNRFLVEKINPPFKKSLDFVLHYI